MADPFRFSSHPFHDALSFVASALVLCIANWPSESAGTETELYHTDFSSFPAGDGKLVGQDGWMSTHPNEMVHGTVDDFFNQGDRSGTLGFSIPETTDKFISVYRPLNYNPVGSKTPIIEFSANVAIVDSIETKFYDSFFLSVFNSETKLLGSIVFDNTIDNLGIWRADGDTFFDTGVGFEHSKLYQIQVRIDFAKNTWTATMDNKPLFTSAPFSNSGATLDLGDFSAEWEISDVDNPGDNWMLFDDWKVRAIGENDAVEPPTVISQIKRRPNGDIFLRWNAEPSKRYQVDISPDFVNWEMVTITMGTDRREGSFVDRLAKSAGQRYYRVRQLP